MCSVCFASANSSSAFCPFVSTISPPTFASGTVNSRKVAIRPTARDTTASYRSRCPPVRPVPVRSPRS